MLAMADVDGLVPATAPGIANTAGVPLDDTRKAIVILESPDPDSKNPNNDGRRIERVNGGYKILNYKSYRAFNYSMNEFAIEKRKYRAKIKEGKKDIVPDNVRTMSGHSASASTSVSSSKEENIRKEVERMVEQFKDIWFKNEKFYIEKYPGLDYNLHSASMEEWIRGNPSKAKKRKDWNLFIQRWLARERPMRSFQKENKIDYRTVGTADEFAADKADIERRKARALAEKNQGEKNG